MDVIHNSYNSDNNILFEIDFISLAYACMYSRKHSEMDSLVKYLFYFSLYIFIIFFLLN